MSTDSLTKEMVLDLSRLMQCLVSTERQIVLFDRISDEDEELEEDGLTEEVAIAGTSWWDNNVELITEIADMFTVSLLSTAEDNDLTVDTFLDSWNSLDSWSDFISETFDCIGNFGDDDNFEYFFDYAVKQSLGFNTGSQEGQDSYGARGVKISETEWLVITKLFQFWWKRKDVFEIFALIHEKTIEGRNVVSLYEKKSSNMSDSSRVPPPIDLNSLDDDECEWWTQFAAERTEDDGTMYIPNPNEDLVYLELMSRAREIECSQFADLISEEIIPGPFAAELILGFVPLHSDILLQLELLQIGMSTVHQWPDVNFDGFHVNFLNLMWATIELVDQKVKDSAHADEILEHFFNSDSFWNEPVVLTSIVALKKPSSETLELLFSKFISSWDFDAKSLKENNDLDLMDHELPGVAPLLAVCVLSPNASLGDVHKILELTTWEENSEFGLYFWEYVCALVSRGEGSSFWCPNTFWRDGFFENGLHHHQTFLDSRLEFECLKFYFDNRDSLNFSNLYGEQVTERHVVELLSKHPEADEETVKEAKLILSTLDDD